MSNMSLYTKHANFGVQMFIKSVKIGFSKTVTVLAIMMVPMVQLDVQKRSFLVSETHIL